MPTSFDGDLGLPVDEVEEPGGGAQALVDVGEEGGHARQGDAHVRGVHQERRKLTHLREGPDGEVGSKSASEVLSS